MLSGRSRNCAPCFASADVRLRLGMAERAERAERAASESAVQDALVGLGELPPAAAPP